MEVKTVYFEKPGPENTEETLRMAASRGKELGIKTAVITSATGATAVKAVETLDGWKVVVVTQVTGHVKPNEQGFLEENRSIVESKGGKVLTVTPIFGGLSRAMLKRFKTLALGGIVAHTLALFGDGMKEACEAVVTAADAGLVRTDEQVIAIGGTGVGADTAIVLFPIHSLDFWDLRIGEILCKPRFL